MIFVGLIQTILHYLGMLAMIGGVIAIIFGNRQRGTDLLISGVLFIVIKYVIGIIFVGAMSLKPNNENSSNEDHLYDQLVNTLNQIKHGNAPTDQKKHISLRLISGSGISDADKRSLVTEMHNVYKSPK